MFTKRLCTAQKMNFSIKDFFSKYDKIRNSLHIWLHLLKKSLMENFIFCAVIALMVSKASKQFSKTVDLVLFIY